MRLRFVMRFILPACIWLLPLVCAGQNTDSLWAIFHNKDSSVETRVVSLHRMARAFMYNNPDSTVRLTQIEYEFAAEHGDTVYMAHALNLQGGALSVKSAFAESLDRFHQVLDLRLAAKDTLGTAGAYNNIGNIYFYKGDYSRALQYYIRSLHFEQMKDSDEGLATSYINIGSIYALQDEFVTALEYFKRALSLYEKHNEISGIASCYANMGNIYKSLDSMDLAHSYFLRSIPIMTSLQDMYNLGVVYSNLADSYRLRGELDSMYESYSKSEQVRVSLNDTLGLAHLYVARGQAMVEMQQYRPAVQDCERGYTLAQPFKALGEMKRACECLSQAYKGLNLNERALNWFEQVIILGDSIAADETRLQLRIMEFRHQAAEDSIRREEEKLAVAVFRQRREHRQWSWAFAVGGILLASVAILFVMMRRTRRSKAIIEQAKNRADSVLLSVLPPEVAAELLDKGKVVAKEFGGVSVLFTDFAGFTRASASMPPQEMLEELNLIYRKFDEIVSRHQIRKIKSIGDAYMAAGGLPVSSADTIRQTVLAALAMQEFISEHTAELIAAGKEGLRMRAGIHTGQVIAGIVGFQNFQYDIWGDTVNLASRMERHGVSGKVNVSRSVYDALKNDATFHFESRGTIEVKGKGNVEMWFVERAQSDT